MDSDGVSEVGSGVYRGEEALRHLASSAVQIYAFPPVSLSLARPAQNSFRSRPPLPSSATLPPLIVNPPRSPVASAFPSRKAICSLSLSSAKRRSFCEPRLRPLPLAFAVASRSPSVAQIPTTRPPPPTSSPPKPPLAIRPLPSLSVPRNGTAWLSVTNHASAVASRSPFGDLGLRLGLCVASEAPFSEKWLCSALEAGAGGGDGGVEVCKCDNRGAGRISMPANKSKYT
ncbi:proline-rich receptor-like protein kinase PERK14 [Syzygium oleosum]|uniref:proline-rich receptor-like protein kinase PERK14 n=1 Tax=Syzygium oleosum TaxID=219896 RepID=UPI0024B88A8B|nr:proline-rich receptor-like protein kinase PERK14 [Syzygium oleosum]